MFIYCSLSNFRFKFDRLTWAAPPSPTPWRKTNGLRYKQGGAIYIYIYSLHCSHFISNTIIFSVWTCFPTAFALSFFSSMHIVDACKGGVMRRVIPFARSATRSDMFAILFVNLSILQVKHNLHQSNHFRCIRIIISISCLIIWVHYSSSALALSIQLVLIFSFFCICVNSLSGQVTQHRPRFFALVGFQWTWGVFSSFTLLYMIEIWISQCHISMLLFSLDHLRTYAYGVSI